MSDRKTSELPETVQRESEESPIDQLEHAVSCLDSIASSFRAIAIVYASKYKETLEAPEAQAIRDLLDLE